MFDLSSVIGFDWDAGNDRKNVHKHDVTRAEAEQTFFNEPLLLLEDFGHSAVEARYHALGRTDGGRRLHITFTPRSDGALIRVISARDMSRRERRIYEQAS